MMTPMLQPAVARAKTHLSLTPQCGLVLDFLRSGRTLTNLIAITTLSIGSLSKRVAELRALGHRIISEAREDFRGKKYHAYFMEG